MARLIDRDSLYIDDNNIVFDGDSFEYFYYYSKFRENILNWYPISKNDEVLEVGSNYGELTGLLCDKAKYVYSLEADESKASINYRRNYELDNLDIEIIDFYSFKTDKRFDLIVLNNTIDYADSILMDNPYYSLLEKCKSLLNENGKILLITNNKMAIKYISTKYNNDDYNDVDYDIRTFNKTELELLFEKCGLSVNKFLYPYPDCRFPFEIFTDSTIDKITPSSINLPLNDELLCLYDIDDLYRDMMSNNTISYYTNSFLVELGLNDISRIDNYDYIKISNNRDDRFSIYTILDYKNNKAIKKALSNKAIEHLKTISKYSRKKMIFDNLEYVFKDDCLSCDILDCKNMSEMIEDCLDNKDEDGARELLDIVKNRLISGEYSDDYYSGDFIRCFGNKKVNEKLHWIKDVNIDVLTDNLFYVDRDYKAIDCEWCFDFYIPGEFILWRVLFNSSRTIFSKDPYDLDMLEYIGISLDTARVFFDWEQYFVYEYVGGNKLMYKNIGYISDYYDFVLNNIQSQLDDTKRELEFNRDHLNWSIKQIKKITDIHEDLIEFLYRLTDTRIYKSAADITRFKQQLLKGNMDDKKDYFRWLFKDKLNDRQYDPIYAAIKVLEDSNDEIKLFHQYRKEYARKDVVDRSIELSRRYDRYDVIVLSIIDYNFRFQRPQHIAKRFAGNGHRVFYVNANFAAYYNENNIDDNVINVSLESEESSIYDTDFNDLDNMYKQISDMIVDHCIGDAVVLVDYPNWVDIAYKLKQQYNFKIVTDYMDDFSGFINPVLDRV